MNIRIDEQVILKSLRKTVQIIDTRTKKSGTFSNTNQDTLKSYQGCASEEDDA